MRKFLGLSIACLILLASCKREDMVKTIGGDYKGIYYRSYPNTPGVDYIHSNVTIHFGDGRYSGTSDVSNFPLLCQGIVAQDASVLTITNTCMFTANLDWTYILDGQYQYSYGGHSLCFHKSYPNGMQDNYELTRQ